MRLELNFASRRYVNRRLVNRFCWLLAAVLVCLLFWLLIQSLLTRDRIHVARTQLSVIQQEEAEVLGTKSISLESLDIENLRTQFATNQLLLDQDAFHWTALFDRMEQLLPAGVSIRRFQPDYEQQSLAIEGVAKNLSALQMLLDQLLKEESISQAYLNSQSQTKVQDAAGNDYSALSFSISLEGVF